VTGALLLTGHEATGYTCVRSLERRGVETVVASEKPGVPAAASRYCGESILLPSPREDHVAYRDEVLALAERPDVQTVLPVRPEDAYLLSRYREAFEERTSVVAPSFDRASRVFDRLRLVRAAEAAGVPVPETALLSEVEDWDRELLVKARYNVLGEAYVEDYEPGQVDVVKSVEHLPPGSEPDVEAIRAEMRHEPIVQAFVPKDGEYMFAGLYDHGEPLATFQHRQIRGDSYTGGGGVYRRSVDLPELESVARRLLAELDWHGLACIEYVRHAETGEFVLVEINPRFWQSLPSTVHAGADFPYYYWLQALGRQAEIDPSYETGVGTHMLRGELGYLASIRRDESDLVEAPPVARESLAVLGSCLREPHFDYLSPTDPGPFLRGLYNTVPIGGVRSWCRSRGRRLVPVGR